MATEQDLRRELDRLKTVQNKTAEQEKYLELLEKHLKIIDRINESLEEQQAIAEKILQNTNDTNLKRQANLMLQENMERLHQRRIDLLKEQIKSEAKSGEINEENLKNQIKLLKNLEDVSDVAQDMPDFIKGLFGGDPGGAITRTIGKVGGSIESQLTNNIKQAALGAETMGGAIKAAIGPAAVLAVFLFATEIAKLAIEVGNAENSFMKTTGASEDFARSLSFSYAQTRKFGGDLKDVSGAMTSLYNNFTDFTIQNEATRESLIKTSVVLEKLGVSNDTFSRSIQNLTKSMGFNAESAAQQLLNLEKFAEELGVAPSKIAADFAGAGGTLAKFGNQGVEAFKRLEIASKITGMEMQRILTLTEKFDTFEGAATMAGKLNAALGGNFVNAMDLMMDTDPVGRFEQIRDAILSTGMSFDDMTYFQKNMYKEMLGLQDVGELALLLSGRTDLMSQSFEQSAQSYEEAAERAKLVADFQEQLKMLFAEMIPVLTPIIDIFRTFFQTMAPFAPLIGLISRLAAVVLMLASALGMIATIFSPVGPLIAGLFGAMAIFNYLGGSIEYINNVLDKLIRGFSNFATRLFRTKNSPTIFEGVGILSDKFKDMSNNIEGTTVSIRTQTQELNRSPVPQAAEEMETIQNPSLMQRVFGSDASQSTQTVRQPISISLNGDKLKEFVIEVVGEKIKEVSVTQ